MKLYILLQIFHVAHFTMHLSGLKYLWTLEAHCVPFLCKILSPTTICGSPSNDYLKFNFCPKYYINHFWIVQYEKDILSIMLLSAMKFSSAVEHCFTTSFPLALDALCHKIK